MNIGNYRTFERFPGTWTITKIYKDMSLKWALKLNTITCPKCDHVIGELRNYVFNYIEKLENNGEIKHLGISVANRYIILEDYISKEEIISKLGGE